MEIIRVHIKFNQVQSWPKESSTTSFNTIEFTIATRCLLGLTFPDLTWHPNETRSLAIVN